MVSKIIRLSASLLAISMIAWLAFFASSQYDTKKASHATFAAATQVTISSPNLNEPTRTPAEQMELADSIFLETTKDIVAAHEKESIPKASRKKTVTTKKTKTRIKQEETTETPHEEEVSNSPNTTTCNLSAATCNLSAATCNIAKNSDWKIRDNILPPPSTSSNVLISMIPQQPNLAKCF